MIHRYVTRVTTQGAPLRPFLRNGHHHRGSDGSESSKGFPKNARLKGIETFQNVVCIS